MQWNPTMTADNLSLEYFGNWSRTSFIHSCHETQRWILMDWILSHIYQIWSYAKHFKIYWPVFFITFLIVFVFVPKKNFLLLLDFLNFFTFRLTALIVVQCWLHYVVTLWTLCWKCEQGNGNGSVHLYKCALQCWPVNLHSD